MDPVEDRTRIAADNAGTNPTRDTIEARVRAILGKPRVRVVWATGAEIADVLVGADSVPDAVWSALRFLLADLRFAAWDVEPADEYGAGAGTLAELLAAGERAAARPGSALARSSAGETVSA